MVIVKKSLNAIRASKAVPIALVVAMGLSLSACSGDGTVLGALDDFEDGLNDLVNQIEDDISPVTIEEFLNNDSTFGTLLTRLQQAGLADDLLQDNDGMGWTLFAPDETAFSNDPLFENFTLDEQIDAVESFLHSGTLLSDELVPGEITMNDGSVVLVEIADNGVITVGGATIVRADIDVSNGVIHRIDSLITTQ